MSDYERRAWERLVGEASAGNEARTTRIHQAAGRVKIAAKTQAERSMEAIMSLPKADEVTAVINQSMETALKALHGVTVDFGLNSVDEDKVVARFQKKEHAIECLEDIRTLDLRACDKLASKGKQAYMAAGMAEGAITSLAITGITVSSTVTGGVKASVAIGAIATDITTVLVGMGRIIADVAAHYGYDVTEPEEAVIASGVLSYSTASGSSQKAATLSSLSKLTQDMMRRKTMEQLTKNQTVRVIEQVFKSVGITMTRKKLAQAVPIAGILINTGLNAKLVNDTYARARVFYRLRFLADKYDLNPADWVNTKSNFLEEEYEVMEDIVLVDEVVLKELK